MSRAFLRPRSFMQALKCAARASFSANVLNVLICNRAGRTRSPPAPMQVHRPRPVRRTKRRHGRAPRPQRPSTITSTPHEAHIPSWDLNLILKRGTVPSFISISTPKKNELKRKTCTSFCPVVRASAPERSPSLPCVRHVIYIFTPQSVALVIQFARRLRLSPPRRLRLRPPHPPFARLLRTDCAAPPCRIRGGVRGCQWPAPLPFTASPKP
jgi:hypothetical protein